MSPESRARIMGALHNARGDDLERANMAFKGKTEAELDAQWGSSGNTCRQVWAMYKADRAAWNKAIAEFEAAHPLN